MTHPPTALRRWSPASRSPRSRCSSPTSRSTTRGRGSSGAASWRTWGSTRRAARRGSRCPSCSPCRCRSPATPRRSSGSCSCAPPGCWRSCSPPSSALRAAAGRPRALRASPPPRSRSPRIVLLTDDVTHWSRQVAGGMAEPLLVALVLGAVARRARRQAAGRARARRAGGAAAARGLPAAGALRRLVLARASRARGRSPRRSRSRCPRCGSRRSCSRRRRGERGARADAATSDPLEALGWARRAAARRRLAAGARRAAATAARACSAPARCAWIAVVAAMTLAGFAGLPRFMAPAAAVVGVLGGAGLAALLRRAARAWARALAVVAALVVTRDRAARPRRRGAARLAQRGADQRLARRACASSRARSAATGCWPAGGWRRATCSCARRWPGSSACRCRRSSASARRRAGRAPSSSACRRRRGLRQDVRAAATLVAARRRVERLLDRLPGDRERVGAGRAARASPARRGRAATAAAPPRGTPRRR